MPGPGYMVVSHIGVTRVMVSETTPIVFAEARLHTMHQDQPALRGLLEVLKAAEVA
jgi:hypothetical protein